MDWGDFGWLTGPVTGYVGGQADNEDPNSAGFFWDVADPLDFTGKKAKNANAGHAAKQAELRAQAKAKQLNLLNSKKAPTLTPQQDARLRALESESQLKLHEDPQFQAQMRMATGGGAQALSGIQNRQAASGATGGFANQGSMSDVYDRLGTQLAALAQEQNKYAGQKRDAAAEGRQAVQDANTAFENAKIEAQMAIEAGDYQGLASAMDRLYAAQAQADAAMKQNVISLGQMVAGAYTGNAGMAANGAGSMQNTQPLQTQGGQQPGGYPVGNYSGMGGNNFGVQGNKPYYQTKMGW